MLTNLVLNRKMSEELVKAGIVLKANHVWVCDDEGNSCIDYPNHVYMYEDNVKVYPAPLLEELLEMLPKYSKVCRGSDEDDNEYYVEVKASLIFSKDPKEAAAKWLIKLSKEK